jgi:hypothetical protein
MAGPDWHGPLHSVLPSQQLQRSEYTTPKPAAVQLAQS